MTSLDRHGQHRNINALIWIQSEEKYKNWNSCLYCPIKLDDILISIPIQTCLQVDGERTKPHQQCRTSWNAFSFVLVLSNDCTKFPNGNVCFRAEEYLLEQVRKQIFVKFNETLHQTTNNSADLFVASSVMESFVIYFDGCIASHLWHLNPLRAKIIW